MSEGRSRRRAKKARRDARRMTTRIQATPEETLGEAPGETPLVDEVRKALASEHPLDLLGLVSMLIQATRPDPLGFLRSRQRESVRLDDLVAGFIGVQIPETTALLGVFAELIVDADDLRDRCRQEVAAREDPPPAWIVDLPHIQVYRAVRMAHVLGDGDELLIGVRLTDGRELTCAVFIDRNTASAVKDAFFVPDSIDKVLAIAAERNTDPDTSFVDMSLAEASSWIRHGIEKPMLLLLPETDSWPGCRPLVEWLIGRMPEGGANYQRPEWEWEAVSDLIDTFLASAPGRPFNDVDHREVLAELIDTGTGDPLRWSVARIQQALSGSPFYSFRGDLEGVFDAPDLLRAFIPFAHAQSGIRETLTSEALAAIDQLEVAYQTQVLQEAQDRGSDDEDY